MIVFSLKRELRLGGGDRVSDHSSKFGGGSGLPETPAETRGLSVLGAIFEAPTHTE